MRQQMLGYLPSMQCQVVCCQARGYAYAKIEYVSVRTYLSKNRIRTLRILEPWFVDLPTRWCSCIPRSRETVQLLANRRPTSWAIQLSWHKPNGLWNLGTIAETCLSRSGATGTTTAWWISWCEKVLFTRLSKVAGLRPSCWRTTIRASAVIHCNAIITSAEKGDYVFTSVCLYVCLSVCLSVRRITEKVVNGFWRNFWRGRA